ncbi:MAG: T9SS type A sorting domain-containing protein [Bacteroidetes bacterium]|nr:T9SS type A sorting domain-containing protein [Bacteroidota bacterium]
MEKTFFSLIVLVLCFAIKPIVAQTVDSSEGDRQALMDLFQSTNGSQWKNKKGWSTNSMDLKDDIWGVGVEMIGGELRVVHIDLQRGTKSPPEPFSDPADPLPGNNIEGQLPSSIGNLSEIRYFNIKQNFFTGTLPQSIGKWTKVERILIGGHTREPALGKYNHPIAGGVSASGKTLHSTNKFSGSIPDIFGNLTSLEVFEAQGLAQLTPSLKDSNQGFTGTIPNNWPSSLQMLFLGGNHLEGNIPVGLTNTDLRILHLYFNNMSGNLIPELGNLIDATHIRLGENNFTGSIPSQWSGFQALRLLTMEKNDITGELPAFLFDGRNSFREGFRVEFNNMSGEIPQNAVTTGDSRHWNVFSLAYNNFSGPIPDWVANLRWIQLNLQKNNFSGDLPAGFHDSNALIWKRIRNLRLNDNNLTGPLPQANPGPKIWLFYLQNNDFDGTFSSEFGESTTTRTLRVRVENNNLSGRVPANIVDITNLSELFLSGNRFSQSDLEDIKNAIPGSVDYRDRNQNPVNGDNGSKDDGSSTSPAPAPSLQAPAVNATDVPVQTAFEWSSVSGADFYELQLNEKGASQLTADARVTGTTYAPSGDLTYSTTYEWRVRAEVNGEPGVWSRFRDFTTEADPNTNDGDDGDDGGQVQKAPAPAPVSPAHLGTDVKLNTVFEWDPVENADYYELHSNRLDPTEMVIVAEVSETTYTHSSNLDPEAIHHWRVRAVVNGEAGEWSPIWEFTTGTEAEQTTDEKTVAAAPVPVYPGNNTSDVSTEVEFKWNSVEGADYYELHSNRLNPDEMRIETDVTDTSYVHSSSLEAGTTHHWRVRAVVNGEPGEWSNIWEFTTAATEETPALASPVLHAPSNDIETESYTPTFEWAAVEGADYYVLQAGTQTPDEIIMEVTVDTNSYTPSQQLDPETSYHWRVRAISDTLEGEWSEVWTFTTSKEQEVVTSVDPGEQPVQTGISQNYPNPFNPSTNIEFTLEEIQNVSLRVYDMAGRQVAVLVDGMRQAGRHSSTFKADHLASGVYFYRLVTEKQSFTKKMTLLK